MSAPTGDICSGYGSTVTMSTSAWTMHIVDLKFSGQERKAIDTTNFGTSGGYMTYIPACLIEPGTMVASTIFNPGNVIANTVGFDIQETFTVTFPVAPGHATATTWAFSGFVQSLSEAIPLNDRMMQDVTIKISGVITVVHGA